MTGLCGRIVFDHTFPGYDASIQSGLAHKTCSVQPARSRGRYRGRMGGRCFVR